MEATEPIEGRGLPYKQGVSGLAQCSRTVAPACHAGGRRVRVSSAATAASHGVSPEKFMAATGWQAHSVRAGSSARLSGNGWD